MNRIRLLPDHVANQIAAGEVVERPASVVKELVENALDAEARRITVEIGAGGRSLIRVADDGWGMGKDDALLCLERHATSKIRLAGDLASIGTMGFRGEAIPSIASVSRFTLTTRERSENSGEATQIVISGGKIIEVKAAPGPSGTTVEVRQLFFNLPARRKFLRSEETERSHIQHYLTLAALSNPQVGFTFLSDQRPIWQLPPLPGDDESSRVAAVRERLRQLQGGELALLRVDYHAPTAVEAGLPETGEEPEAQRPDPRPGIRVWGFIGAPGVSRATREDQHVFVNRRPVENRGINFALLEGYHTALMKGRYPVGCIFLEIDPAAVDVNIHPSKREVKFRDEGEVRRIVAQAVRETLLQFHSSGAPAREIHAGFANAPDSVRASPPASQTASTHSPEFFTQTRPAKLEVPPLAGPPTAPLHGRANIPLDHTEPSEPECPAAVPAGPVGGAALPARPTTATAAAFPGEAVVPLLHVPLRLIGVVGRLYVVLESDRGLVLMDQHAAHERVLFEQMLARMESNQEAPSQRLLLPETVELPVRDALFVRENLVSLSRLGVVLREFGERTFLLDALPPFIRGRTPKQFTLGLIDELKAAGTGVNNLRLGEDVIAKTVCRHAVKANDSLDRPELEKLVGDLRGCTMPYTCPHGRPTLIEMSWRELEKKFGRTGMG